MAVGKDKVVVPIEAASTNAPKALGEELKSTSAVLVPKLRTELAELANSLKVALGTAKACREKMRRDQAAAEEVQEVLKADLARVEA
ncbi:hypothetical protein ACSQ67_025754 [Phaseolus vulgaris]